VPTGDYEIEASGGWTTPMIDRPCVETWDGKATVRGDSYTLMDVSSFAYRGCLRP
jgi:hypothetical protein